MQQNSAGHHLLNRLNLQYNAAAGLVYTEAAARLPPDYINAVMLEQELLSPVTAQICSSLSLENFGYRCCKRSG